MNGGQAKRRSVDGRRTCLWEGDRWVALGPGGMRAHADGGGTAAAPNPQRSVEKLGWGGGQRRGGDCAGLHPEYLHSEMS